MASRRQLTAGPGRERDRQHRGPSACRGFADPLLHLRHPRQSAGQHQPGSCRDRQLQPRVRGRRVGHRRARPGRARHHLAELRGVPRSAGGSVRPDLPDHDRRRQRQGLRDLDRRQSHVLQDRRHGHGLEPRRRPLTDPQPGRREHDHHAVGRRRQIRHRRRGVLRGNRRDGRAAEPAGRSQQRVERLHGSDGRRRLDVGRVQGERSHRPHGPDLHRRSGLRSEHPDP